MAKADEPWTQLATRIPKELHRRLKLYCVTREIAVQDFVVEALKEKLGRKTGRKKGDVTPMRAQHARLTRRKVRAAPLSEG